jgi:hypothetical protein
LLLVSIFACNEGLSAADSDVDPADVGPNDISVDVTPSDVTPSDVTPSDVTPSDVTPSDVTPSDCTQSRELRSNGLDDDGDRDVDCLDGDCFGSPECASAGTEICNNGSDNDRNGFIDCRDPACVDFPGCDIPPHPFELECNNGVDDDALGLFDCDDDDCDGAIEGTPDGQPEFDRSNGLDDDADGFTDCEDRDCLEFPECFQQVFDLECFDGRENDADGAADCADPDCVFDCREEIFDGACTEAEDAETLGGVSFQDMELECVLGCVDDGRPRTCTRLCIYDTWESLSDSCIECVGSHTSCIIEVCEDVCRGGEHQCRRCAINFCSSPAIYCGFL